MPAPAAHHDGTGAKAGGPEWAPKGSPARRPDPQASKRRKRPGTARRRPAGVARDLPWAACRETTLTRTSDGRRGGCSDRNGRGSLALSFPARAPGHRNRCDGQTAPRDFARVGGRSPRRHDHLPEFALHATMEGLLGLAR